MHSYSFKLKLVLTKIAENVFILVYLCLVFGFL